MKFGVGVLVGAAGTIGLLALAAWAIGDEDDLYDEEVQTEEDDLFLSPWDLNWLDRLEENQ